MATFFRGFADTFGEGFQQGFELEDRRRDRATRFERPRYASVSFFYFCSKGDVSYIFAV